jgi:hypothetical protein
MLLGQGGTLADRSDEIKPGGFIGEHRVEKVTRDKAGRINKVYFLGPSGCYADRNGNPYGEGNPATLTLHAFDAEKIKPGSYREATPEEAQAFEVEKKARKDCAPKAPPILNLSLEDAQTLQTHWNRKRVEALRAAPNHYGTAHKERILSEVESAKPEPMTQEQYTARSVGYGPCKTLDICADWMQASRHDSRPVVFRVRVAVTGSYGFNAPPSVVSLTDKPTKPLPDLVVADEAEVENVAAR